MFSKKTILTLLSALFACLIIGVFFSTPDTEELFRQMFARKVHSDKKFEIIVAGDSRVYRGVSTSIIGEELNMASINLGFSSAGFSKNMFDLIDNKIEDKPGNIIILGISPFSLTDQGIENGHIKQVKSIKAEEVIEYLYLSRMKNLFVATNPLKIWDNIFKKKPSPNNYVQIVSLDEGWVASDYLQPNKYNALKSYKKTMTGTQISYNTIENLYSKIRYWSDKGFLVFGFTPPSSADMEELERQYTIFNDHDIVNGFLEAGGKWISLKGNYTSYDGSHLDSKSAIKLSNEISNAIKSETYFSDISENSIILTNYYPLKSKYNYLEDFENGMDNTLVTDIAHSGKTVLLCDSSIIELNIFNTNTEYIVEENIEKVLVDLYVYYEDENTSAKVVFDLQQDEKSILSNSLQVSYIVKPKKWGNVKFEFSIPKSITKNDTLSIDIINPGKTRILFDDFMVRMY